ncbi:MAG TPA: hypothetical protein EYG52_19190 [Pseudomonadales bacterium]|nr:hypothetical protein [Pseudomonadales bacterium]
MGSILLLLRLFRHSAAVSNAYFADRFTRNPIDPIPGASGPHFPGNIRRYRAIERIDIVNLEGFKQVNEQKRTRRFQAGTSV